MHEGVLTCHPETSVQEAAKRMVEHDVSALVVVDEQERLIGLLSRTDLVKTRLHTQDKEHWRSVPVSQIMVSNVVSVHVDETLDKASQLMMDRHIHRVVVVEDVEGGIKPLGILSVTDVVRDMAAD
jgi:CBS domain-containing protein